MNFNWLGSARKRQAKEDADASSAENRGKASALGQSEPMADGRPLSLLRYDAESKKFEIGEEAIRSLENIKGPVGVIAVCGRARQGKSFILNQLLGKMGGFQVGPSVRPCTKGLWLWSKPLPLKSPTGSTFHVVLLDSEGIDATDQTGTYSTAIFSLGILLSSLFVYNQMGGIDESALDKLSLVTQMTRHIQVRAGGSKDSSIHELGQFSPKFLWLLRDFYLDLEVEKGHTLTLQEYLEQSLAPVPGRGPQIASKNSIREAIRSLFPQRECRALVRPVNDEKLLRQLDSVDPEELRNDFKQGLEDLMDTILTMVEPKCLFQGRPLNGKGLAHLCEIYVQAINNGAVPVISSAWESVATQECRKAYDMAISTLSSKLEGIDSLDPRELEIALGSAMEQCLGIFESEALDAGEIKSKYKNDLRKKCLEALKASRTKAKEAASSKCRDLANSVLVKPVLPLIEEASRLAYELRPESGNLDITKPLRKVKDVLAGVDSACKSYQAGIPVESAPIEHLHGALSIVLTKLMESVEIAIRRSQDSVNELKKSHDEELRALRIEMERLVKQMTEGQKRSQSQIEDLTASNALLQHEKNMVSSQIQEYRHQVSQLKDSENTMRMEVQKKNEQLQSTQGEMEGSRYRISQAESQNTILLEQVQRLQTAANEYRAVNDQARQDLETSRQAAAESERSERVVRNELHTATERIAHLSEENRALGGDNALLRAQLSEKESETMKLRTQLQGYEAKLRDGAAQVNQESAHMYMDDVHFNNYHQDEAIENQNPVRQVEQWTINELKQKLTEAGFAHEIMTMKKPSKQKLVAMYKDQVLAHNRT